MQVPYIYSILFALFFLAVSNSTMAPACAKAAFKSAYDMASSADVVAVVDIKSVEKVSKSAAASNWTYSEKATANPIELLKGDLKNGSEFFGGEDFICAQVHFQPGRSLVFLKRNGGLLTGNNWHLSARPIIDQKIEWYTDGSIRLSPQPASKVIGEVKSMLKDSGKLANLPDYLTAIKAASTLVDGAVGEGGSSSVEFESYKKAVANAKKDREALSALTSVASPAGRIYAAMALNAADPKAARLALERLSGDKSLLVVRSGCEVLNVTVGDFARSILKSGNYCGFKI